ncbi:phage tail spike protein [Clostridium baratii]|uniref:phage tail protein n=1 Tax=Clostridium baratii TaxID=1561 RepID=UPI003D7A04F1
MIQLLNKDKKKIAGLILYKDLSIESVLKSGDKTLSFFYPKKAKFYEQIEEEGYIRTKTNEFVIKEKFINGELTEFKCILNVEDLEGNPFDRFESIEQTIENALNLALVGTGWLVGKCGLKKKRTVRKTNCSSWDIIQEIKTTYRVDLVFNTLNKTIDVYKHLGEYKGTYFSDSINLKAIEIQGNSYDYATRIIPIGKDGIDIKSINNGKDYVENYQYSNKKKAIYWIDDRYTIAENLKEDAEAKLNEISKPYRSYSTSIINLAEMNDKYKNILDYKLGDTIYLISKDNKIKEKQRIIKIIEYPEDHRRDTVELANATLKFEDIQKQFQDTVDTVDNITTDNGTVNGSTIDEIDTNQIKDFKLNVLRAAEVHIIKADIQDLNVEVLKVGQAILTKVDTTQLNALESKLHHALIGKADVNELNVAVEKVGIIEGKTASIENALNKNLTAENFHSNAITAGSGIIANGAIGDAQISSLSGNKLEFGTVNTSKVTISGPDGRFRIIGNKLQILDDKNGKLFERIMLGVDNNNKSTLVLRGKDGQTTLINENGLTDAGFTSGYEKVNDDSLDASKFDKNSIVRQVNGSTETIKGTKVQIGDRTLDVELSTQKNTIIDHGKELSTQKAIIQALDDQVKLKVDTQTFKESTNSINTSINTAENNAKAHADQVAEQKKQDAIKNANAYTTAQITTTNSNLSKATSEINVLKGQLSTKVGQTDIDRSISNIKFGDRNLAINSDFRFGWRDWGFNNPGNNADIEVIDESTFGKCAKITMRNNYQGIYQGMNRVRGNVYSWSVWLKANKPGTITISHEQGEGSKDIKLTTEWTRYTGTGIWNGPGGCLCFYSLNDTNELVVYISRLKYVEGNTIPLSWTSAPEDINQAIIESAKKTGEKISTVESELKQTKESFGVSVKDLNSKTQTIETNITNINTNLTNKINTAKTDAITSAKTYTNTQITTVNTRVSNAESSINVLKNQISTKVSQTDIDKTVNNIKIGGRNLALDTSLDFTAQYSSFNGGENTCPFLAKVLTKGLKTGDKITIRLIYSYENVVPTEGKQAQCWIQGSGNTTGWYSGAFNGSPRKTIKGTGEIEFLYTCDINSDHLKNSYWETNIRHDYVKSGNVRWKEFKVEKGGFATDWTPAPEDLNQKIQDNIKNVNQKINTTTSEFTQKTNSITQKVTQIESTTNTLNEKITSNTNRISTAESKLTPNAIINSVNSSISSGGVIRGASTVLDNNKFTVKDNDNSRVELEKGCITAFNWSNKRTYYMNENEIGICAKDNSDSLGMLSSVYKNTLNDFVSKLTPGGAIKGVGLFAGDYAQFLTFGHDNLWGNDSRYDEYLTFNKKGYAHFGVGVDFANNEIQNISRINFKQSQSTLINALAITRGQVNVNTEDGDLWLNYAKGPDTYNKGVKNVNVRIGAGWNSSKHGSLICQDLWVHGNKHNIVNTKELGFVGLHAYEMTEPQFGDNGGGIINNDGYCYIYLDPIFVKTVNTNIEYRVHIDIISDDLNAKVQCCDKQPNYFKVIGTPGVKFDWEVKCKRKGYENNRLDRINEHVKMENGVNNENLGNLSDFSKTNLMATEGILTQTIDRSYINKNQVIENLINTIEETNKNNYLLEGMI